MHRIKLAVLATLLLLGSVMAGSAQTGDRLTVVLDFFVNPSQWPLFVAEAQGFFADAGLDVDLQEPADPSDPPQLAATGRVDVALTTSFDLVIQRDRGLNLAAVGSLIQSPLGGLLSLRSNGIETLADLRGKTIGFALEPEEPALWTAMMRSVGVEPGEYELVNIGFDGIPLLLAGQVDAIAGFRNFEPILLELDGADVVFFPFEDHGIPSSWQLVFSANAATIETKGDEISRFLQAVHRAVEFTLNDPNGALNDFFELNPTLAAEDQRELNIRSALATLLLYQGAPCHNDAEAWMQLQDFIFDQNLIATKAELSDLFRADFLPPVCF